MTSYDTSLARLRSNNHQKNKDCNVHITVSITLFLQISSRPIWAKNSRQDPQDILDVVELCIEGKGLITDNFEGWIHGCKIFPDTSTCRILNSRISCKHASS